MRTRILCLLVGSLVLMIVGLFMQVSRPFPPGPGSNWDNLDKIQGGMTLAEVEAIIGRPFDTPWGPEPEHPAPPAFDSAVAFWSSEDEEIGITVYLDRERRVIAKYSISSKDGPPTRFQRALIRVGLENRGFRKRGGQLW